jgi:enoyl-CoA hydratase/carnithine racemase
VPKDLQPSYHPDVHVELAGYVTTVTIDRPRSRNGCSGDMFIAIGRTFRELAWSGTRAVVLTGANENFCTGADLGGDEETLGTGSVLDGLRALGDVVLAIHDCPVPVVSKVDGLCVGAGLGLALAADLTWCSDRARFSAIFAKRGLSPDFGTSWLLRERLGVHKAKELAYTAKMLSGTEAHELGLVNAVVPAAELDAAVDEVVATIASGPPVAHAITKRQLDHASSWTLAQALEAEALGQNANFHTRDMQEAMTAYAERREPSFEGR